MSQQEKVRLDKLRGTLHIDIPATAVVAKVTPSIVYRMLVRQPVTRSQAEAVLHALSTALRPLSLQTVDVVLWEDLFVLWCIHASNPDADSEAQSDTFHFVYAKDESHAHDLARIWIDQHRPLYSHFTFAPIPEGLVIGDIVIPGKKE